MKKVLFPILALVLALGLVLPAAAHTEGDPFVTDLIAGQHIDAGDVKVWNDGSNLYVQYVTTGGWVLTETHLHVATSMEGIPQNNGNPPPGQFDYSSEYDPGEGVTEPEPYVIPLADLGVADPCDPTMLYIAAHAVVVQLVEDCMDVVSDVDVEWSADGMSWSPTTACWVHPSWADIAGATWVWRTFYTDVVWEYDNVPEGGWYFKKEFTIPGEPVSGEIAINADNTYSLSLNGVYVGAEGSMDKDGPDNHEWGTIDIFPLTNLNSGLNTIEVRALNFFRTGSSTNNPAGLAFNAKVCYQDIVAEETAWGDGLDFSGRNWAMYFTYDVQCPTVTWPEEGTGYIGYEDRANGDYDYNDFGMNMAIEETYSGGCLSSIHMEFESVQHIAGDNHDIHIKRTLDGGTSYAYTIVRSTAAQGNETAAGSSSGSGDFDIVLFDSRYYTVDDTVTIDITITSGCEAYSPPSSGPRCDLDPVFAFYNPYMYDTTTGQTHGIDKWQSAGSRLPDSGTYDVPYILVVPVTDWSVPNENQTITGPYPDFDDYYKGPCDPLYENWYE